MPVIDILLAYQNSNNEHQTTNECESMNALLSITLRVFHHSSFLLKNFFYFIIPFLMNNMEHRNIIRNTISFVNKIFIRYKKFFFTAFSSSSLFSSILFWTSRLIYERAFTKTQSHKLFSSLPIETAIHQCTIDFFINGHSIFFFSSLHININVII